MQGQEAQNLRKKVFWTAVAWYHPSAYVSDSFHWSGDFEFVFTSSYYYHSLILSFSLVILFCRGRKRRTSAKRYFGWRRRDSIRPLKSRMFSPEYTSVNFECFLLLIDYHSLILSFSLVVLFRRDWKRRIFAKKHFGWRRCAESSSSLRRDSRDRWPDLVRRPLVFILFLFYLSFWCHFLRLFTSDATLFFPAQVSCLFGVCPAGGVYLRAGGVLL